MTDDTMVERAEALLRLFDQHQVVHAKRDSEGFSVCSCGWTALGISSDPPALNHRRDVTATALLPLVREAQAGAWQEGNLAASECFTRLIGWATVADPKREDAPDMPTNPYRTGDDHARVTPSEAPALNREAAMEALFRLPGNEGGTPYGEPGFWPYFARPSGEVEPGDDADDVRRIVDAIMALTPSAVPGAGEVERVRLPDRPPIPQFPITEDSWSEMWNTLYGWHEDLVLAMRVELPETKP